MKTTLLSLMIFLTFCMSGIVEAADTAYELRMGGIYSDNVGRNATTELDDTIAFVGIGLDFSQISKRVDFGVLADLDFNHYIDDTFDDEVVGALNADLDFTLVPNFLSWVVTDRFGTLQTDPFRADAANNRGNFNSFETGPDLNIRLGNRTSVGVGGRYRNQNYEERDTDNEVVDANFSISHAVRTNRTVSLSGTVADIDFDDALANQDYERKSAFVSFQSEVSSGTVSIDLGVNEVDIGNETLDGTLVNVSFNRNLTARTSLTVSYDQRYSDSGDIFRRFQESGRNFGDTQDIPGDGEPFESRRFSAALSYNYGGNNFYLRGSSSEEDYDSANTLARQRNEVQVGVGRRLGSDWRVSLDGRFSRIDYENVVREDDNVNASLTLARQITRTLFLDVGYRYADRGSTDSDDDYNENRYSLTLTYRPE